MPHNIQRHWRRGRVIAWFCFYLINTGNRNNENHTGQLSPPINQHQTREDLHLETRSVPNRSKISGCWNSVCFGWLMPVRRHWRLFVELCQRRQLVLGSLRPVIELHGITSGRITHPQLLHIRSNTHTHTRTHARTHARTQGKNLKENILGKTEVECTGEVEIRIWMKFLVVAEAGILISVRI